MRNTFEKDAQKPKPIPIVTAELQFLLGVVERGIALLGVDPSIYNPYASEGIFCNWLKFKPKNTSIPL